MTEGCPEARSARRPARIFAFVVDGRTRRDVCDLPADALQYPSQLGSLMRECWAFEAKSRPDFAMILDALEKVAYEAGMPVD